MRPDLAGPAAHCHRRRARERRAQGPRRLALHPAGARLHRRDDVPGRPRRSASEVYQALQRARRSRRRATTARSSRRILELRREKAAAAGLRRFRRPGAGRPHGPQRRPRHGVPGRPQGQDRAPFPRRRTGSCWNSAARIEGPDAPGTRSPGTSPTTPKSSAPRSTISTRRRCAPTSRWSAWWPACSTWSAASTASACRRSRACPAWDPQVRYYNVRDEDGALLGGFYADWYPRENKRGGAWMDALITGGPAGDGFRPHLGLICGNLTPPIGGPARAAHAPRGGDHFPRVRPPAAPPAEPRGGPQPGRHQRRLGFRRAALADHGELVLGTRGARPVRAPLGDRRAHSRGSVREDEARPHLPRRQRADAAARLRLRRPAAAHPLLRRRGTATPVAYTRRILQEFTPAPLPPDHAMIAAFTHLFASPVGYGAGYYSYKWAEVLDADAFTRFREDGIFSREVGSRVPREHPVPGRQRGPGRTVPQLHGPRSRPARAAGAVRAGVVTSAFAVLPLRSGPSTGAIPPASLRRRSSRPWPHR